MRKILFAAAALTLAVSAGAQAQTVGNAAYSVTIGGILPTTGSNGPIQTPNSLPSPAEIKGAWISPQAYAAARGYSLTANHGYATRSVTAPAS